MSEIKVQCDACGKRFRASRKAVDSLKSCLKCGASPFAYTILEGSSEDEMSGSDREPESEETADEDATPLQVQVPVIVSAPPQASQMQAPLTTSAPPQASPKRRAAPVRFQAEAAKVHRPIATMAVIYFVLGLIALVVVALFYVVSSGLFAALGQNEWALFMLIAGFFAVVLGLLNIYLQFLLLRAVSLSLKYLSVIADRS